MHTYTIGIILSLSGLFTLVKVIQQTIDFILDSCMHVNVYIQTVGVLRSSYFLWCTGRGVFYVSFGSHTNLCHTRLNKGWGKAVRHKMPKCHGS